MEARTDLIRALTQARACTDALFAMVRPDSLYERPIPERHRIIFYLGHLEAFDWNLIGQRGVNLTSCPLTCTRRWAKSTLSGPVVKIGSVPA